MIWFAVACTSGRQADEGLEQARNYAVKFLFTGGILAALMATAFA